MNNRCTDLVYLQDTYRFEDTSRVVAVQHVEGRGDAVILDRTIFYPQGGGQPSDRGLITGESGSFVVEDVRQVEGIVHHFGHFSAGSLPENTQVKLSIESPLRLRNARLHSAGHIIDAAVQLLDLQLVPCKGYHFPQGPYVEYEGEIAADVREQIRQALEQKTNELIERPLKTRVLSASRAELPDLCSFVPDYVSDDQPIRVVSFMDKLGCPCGGTHVANSLEVGRISLTKIKVKSGQTRISYTIPD